MYPTTNAPWPRVAAGTPRATGRALAEAGLLPDLALCSTAERARRTWELASAQWDTLPPVPDQARAMHGQAYRNCWTPCGPYPARSRPCCWSGTTPDWRNWSSISPGNCLDDTLDEVSAKFPTSAIAVLAWRGTDWRDLAPGAALLTNVIVARGGR
ncbi:Histidine phosphatase family protein OS=Streptomyces alboniger OX=132473 GN=CP975_07550 PE=4 SV=1 [Streptomyces alboniger]